LSQRLLGSFFVGVSGSIGETQYLNSSTALSPARNDTTSQIMGNISYVFSRRVSGSVYYQFTKNDSSQGGFAFSSSQVGLNLSYRF
jgi:hypothetical protein